jgi:hypothetical protein
MVLELSDGTSAYSVKQRLSSADAVNEYPSNASAARERGKYRFISVSEEIF